MFYTPMIIVGEFWIFWNLQTDCSDCSDCVALQVKPMESAPDSRMSRPKIAGFSPWKRGHTEVRSMGSIWGWKLNHVESVQSTIEEMFCVPTGGTENF